MTHRRITLSVLLTVALLAPGVILAQPAAPQAGDSNSPPGQSEAPEDFPWQANQSVYAYLPDCTDQGSPDIAIDAAQNLYAVWSDSRDGGSDVYFAYRPNGGAWGANVRVNDLPGTVSGAPKIAVNASGNAYVVWQDYPQRASGYLLCLPPGKWELGSQPADKHRYRNSRSARPCHRHRRRRDRLDRLDRQPQRPRRHLLHQRVLQQEDGARNCA